MASDKLESWSQSFHVPYNPYTHRQVKFTLLLLKWPDTEIRHAPASNVSTVSQVLKWETGKIQSRNLHFKFLLRKVRKHDTVNYSSSDFLITTTTKNKVKSHKSPGLRWKELPSMPSPCYIIHIND